MKAIDRAGIAFWIAPPLLALLLYWPGLTCWFQKDDFAWLGLRQEMVNGHSYWWALFAPLAQGTVRTLSERVFYLSFTALFGLNPLPFRCWAFLTFAVSLSLLTAVCSKLTGSRTAGFWAAVLWTVNGAMAIALSWTAIYYELLCSLVFLLSFWLLLRYVETGETRFYFMQCATFLLGFGVLELNVVYPALASVYALCSARRILAKILPLFLFSAAYTSLHLVVAPLPASGPYQTFWDANVFSTLWIYWKMALGPIRLMLIGIHPSPFRSALALLLIAGLVGFLVWKLSHRQYVLAFFPAWFLIVLAPLLPLRNHIDDSYLTIPLIGLAMWGAWALVSGWRAGALGKLTAVSLLIIYLCVQIPVALATTRSFHNLAEATRKLVFSVAGLTPKRPDELVLLKGVDRKTFAEVIWNRPFRLFTFGDVYLIPEDQPGITADFPDRDLSNFFPDPVQLKSAWLANRVVVLDVSGGQVRDVTAAYRRTDQ